MSVERPHQETRTGRQSSAIDALFCECGSLRRPQEDGTAVCQNDCQHATPRSIQATFEITYTQECRTPQVHDLVDPEEETVLAHDQTSYCKECDATRPVRTEMRQLRATDEPPTRLYECHHCQNRWREDG